MNNKFSVLFNQVSVTEKLLSNYIYSYICVAILYNTNEDVLSLYIFIYIHICVYTRVCITLLYITNE